jgi:hypothetical protein
MAAEAEAAAGLGCEGKGEVVEGVHLRVKGDGFSVVAEVGVGAEEGVGQGDRGWVRHLPEQVVGIGREAARAVEHEERVKTAVVEMAGRQEESVKLGGGGRRERDRALGVEEGEALPDERSGFHPVTDRAEEDCSGPPVSE